MKKIFLLAFLVTVGMVRVDAQTTNYNAYSLILINVAKYAEWPENSSDKFLITVVGKSKVYDELVKKQGYRINNKPVQVNQVNEVGEINSIPQLIYLSDSKSSSLEELQGKYGANPVMVVTEREGLHKKGAHMSFIIIEGNKLRFDINKTEMLKRNLKISNNILTIANEII